MDVRPELAKVLSAMVVVPRGIRIADKLVQPENSLTVEVTVNQVYARPDGFSTFLPVTPPGLNGVPLLCCFDS